ncbi:hypothetical protein QTP70_011429 [Hemibagrus guttatus]|uniref:Complex 1 LYR protein domain-containing protein n=1 Tax=Hemibagrus guttatus TaxID=175788 RepID=A0AAE0RDK4_9TELE|nr:hypothetical protein QTP70_011429 [Hemibagrus guttatus]
MAAPSRTQVLSLYRMLLRESNKVPSYNYRTYALRRVRDAFRENQNVEDPKVLEQLLNKAHDNLAIIQRQAQVAVTKRSITASGAYSSVIRAQQYNKQRRCRVRHVPSLFQPHGNHRKDVRGSTDRSGVQAEEIHLIGHEWTAKSI